MGMQSLERRLERMVEGVFSPFPQLHPADRARSPARSARWTTTAPSTSRASGSCPTNSRSCSPPTTTPVSPTSRTPSAPSSSRPPASTPARRATTSWARSASTLRVDELPQARPLRHHVADQAGAGRHAARRDRPAVRRADRARATGHSRSAACPTATSLPDGNISRHHAEIRRAGSGYVVIDLGSTNGTIVNGERISTEHRLNDGDIISVGSTALRFEAS